MTYSHQDTKQQEACQIAEQIEAIGKQIQIPLDAIDWQQSGIQAVVKVDGIEIASLKHLSRYTSDELLRHIQMKLFEHAARKATHAHASMKALMWTPVAVVQPQVFLSLWIVTMETDERVPIIESLKNGRRVYEPYILDGSDEQFAQLFGPMGEGAYPIGEKVTIQVRERQYSGEIRYILPPGKNPMTRKYASKGHRPTSDKAYPSDTIARYLINCHDGFPHIVNQLQVIRESETQTSTGKDLLE
ncbi:hypothetical protein [Ktedonospora formicarum]|uniref:Uncharacterized protein n=1 Tax=Ktedonospora formicarum TaxID=2778364 RepID=A0A8J3IEJ1_9CHLR|nr:hypothetical protein [Ktedonospora formicarum]GHO50913.1 hypothetical protein KSX_90760 [Ktedonospora formicarum]